MSTDVKTKRVRLTKEEPVAQETKKNDKLAYLENANVPIEEFDWDAHQASCPSRSRKINKGLKNTGKYNVYSHEPYAQDLLDLLLEIYFHSSLSIPLLVMSHSHAICFVHLILC